MRPHRSSTKDPPMTSAQKKSRSKSSNRIHEREYTDDETQNIARIRHCKDYYEILQIERTEFSEITLKKKYRELALKVDIFNIYQC